MRKILIAAAVVVVLGLISGCVSTAHPKNFPRKMRKGITGRGTPEAERENITYNDMLEDVERTHEREQKKLNQSPPYGL